MLQFEDVSAMNIARKLERECGVHQVVVFGGDHMRVGHYNKLLQLLREKLALASRFGCHLRSGTVIITLESPVADLRRALDKTGGPIQMGIVNSD